MNQTFVPAQIKNVQTFKLCLGQIINNPSYQIDNIFIQKYWEEAKKYLSIEHLKDLIRNNNLIMLYFFNLFSKSQNVEGLNSIWRGIFILSEKLIKEFFQSGRNYCRIFLCKLIQLIQTQNLDSKASNLIQFLLLKQNIELKEKTQYYIIKRISYIIKVYNYILSFQECPPNLILKLTYILSKSKDLEKDIQNNIYKLGNWLQNKNLNFQDICLLFNIITNGLYEQQIKNNVFQFNQQIKVKYKTLSKILISKLFECENQHRGKFIVQITQFMIIREQNLLELYFYKLNQQTNRQVVQTIFSYLTNHILRQISTKKVKLLLRNLRLTTLAKFNMIQQQKLKNYIFILKQITKKYPQKCLVMEFNNQSSLKIQNLPHQKQFTLSFLIQLSQRDQKQKIQLLYIHAKKIHIKIQLNLKIQGKKRITHLIITLDKKIILNQIININSNYNVEEYFLSISQKTNKPIIVFLNSIQFKLPEVVNLQMQKIQFGNITKNSNGFIGQLKQLVFFNGQVKAQQIYKQWMDSNKKNHVLFKKMGFQKVLFKLTKGEQVIKVYKHQKSLIQKIMKKNLKYQMININKYCMPSILQLIQQIGNFDCMMYFAQYLNQTLTTNSSSLTIMQQFFVILKYLCLNDQMNIALDWLQNSLNIVGHLFWLIFSKNTISAKSIHLIIKMLDFLLFFQHKMKQQKSEQSTVHSRYRILQCEIVQKILFNLQIWNPCSFQGHKFIYKIIQKRINVKMIYENILQKKQINSLFLALLLYCNNNEKLSQEQNNFLEDQLIKLIKMIMLNKIYNKDYYQRDLGILLTYIFVSQDQSNQFYKFSAKRLYPKLLNLFTQAFIRLDKIKILIKQNRYISKLYLFFCRLIKKLTYQNIQTYKILVRIIFKLIQIQGNQQCIIMNLLNHLQINSKQNGLCVSFYFYIFNELVKSNLKSRLILIQTLLKHLSYSIKICEKLDSLESIQNNLFQLSEQSFLIFVNSEYLFQIFDQIRNQQGIQRQIVQKLLKKIFIFCFNSSHPERSIPFFQSFLKLFPQFDISNNPVYNHSIHILIQYIDHKFSSKFLIQNKLLDSKPFLRPFTRQQQQSQIDYEGGTLSHYLCKQKFSFFQLEYLNRIINYRHQKFEKYEHIPNLVQFFLVDIVFLEAVKLYYSQYELNETNKNKNIVNQTLAIDQVENTVIQTQISQQQQKLLKLILNCCNQQRIQNMKKLKRVQIQIQYFLKLLEKQTNRNTIKNAYFKLNKDIIQNISLLKIQEDQYKQIDKLRDIFQKVKNQEGNQKLIVLKEFLSEEHSAVNKLLNFIDKYSKKDIRFSKKYHIFSTYKIQNFTKPVIQMKKYINQQNQDLITDMCTQFTKQIQNILKIHDNVNQENQVAWRKIIKKNMFWILNKNDQNGICEVDLHQCRNYYYLNIRPVNQKRQFAKYPRRIQIKDDNLQENKTLKTKKRASVLQSPKQQNILNESQIINVQKKNIKQIFFAQYVTQRGVYFGRIYIKNTHLYFTTINESQMPNELQYKLSTSSFHKLKQKKQKKIEYENSTLFTRRYILRHTGIEIFTKSKSYFFNLFFQQKRKNFINLIKNKVFCIINRKMEFQRLQLTKKWLNGEFNNFQYLMLLNRYSGRTYNDLSQFPVFPWVISNYSDKIQQLGKNFYKDQNNFRNLEYPMGKINDQRFKNFKIRMNQIGKQIKESYFLYGTFYSNPTVLYNFFIRLQPFTTLHWQHQGQKIDHADRLFSGIQQQYNSAINNTSDVKQIIPQFYYWPQFLKNRNQVYLGKKQNKQEVNNIKLPGWSKTPQEFVFRMRQVLESPRVTQKLHLWIDLIFGYKTMSMEEAEKHDNLFQSNMYQSDMFKQSKNQQQIRVKQLTISQFGQVPEFLFTKEHPKKIPRKGLKLDSYLQIGKFENMKNFQFHKQGLFVSGDKEVYFINTFLSIVNLKFEKKKFENNGQKTILIKQKEFSWISSKDNCLRLYNKKEIYKKMLESDIFAINFLNNLLFSVNGSKIVVYKLLNNYSELERLENLYGHQDQITHIILNQNIDILLTVDNDQLVLIHYMSILKYLRNFKLSLNMDEKIKQIRIHDMGYFLFLTNSNRILLYTYFGQIFVETDFISQNDEYQKITNIQFSCQYQSEILFSTVEGNIYQIDFFDIWRFKQQFPYLPYVLKKKKNILAKCYKYPQENKQNKLKYMDLKIKNQIIYFNIIKTSNQYKGLYKIVVLYKNGDLFYFYQKAMIKQQLQNTTFLKQMGMF